MKISKRRFEEYRKVQKSGVMNMYGYHDAKAIIPNFNSLIQHFEVDKRTEDWEK